MVELVRRASLFIVFSLALLLECSPVGLPRHQPQPTQRSLHPNPLHQPSSPPNPELRLYIYCRGASRMYWQYWR